MLTKFHFSIRWGRLSESRATSMATKKYQHIYQFIVLILLTLNILAGLRLYNALGEDKYTKTTTISENNLKPYHGLPVARTSIVVIHVNQETVFTAYTLSPDETDNSPCIGAGNNNLCQLSQEISICASRDLPLDTKIYIDGFGECIIKDRMNKRYKGTGRIDILMDTKEEAINFGIKKLNYIIL